MKFCFAPGGLPIIGRIEKDIWPTVLGYIVLSLGIASAIWIACEATYKTENSEFNGEPPFRITVNKKTKQDVSFLPTLFSSDDLADMPTDRERFRIAGNDLNDALLMEAPVAKLTAKIVGLLSDKSNRGGMAIIESSGRQQSYASDEKINDTFPIIKILPDRIIINENGFYAALILEN